MSAIAAKIRDGRERLASRERALETLVTERRMRKRERSARTGEHVKTEESPSEVPLLDSDDT